MEYKTTQKNIRYMYSGKIYSVGYCGACYLLRGLDRFAYNSGVYGWNCDYYAIDGLCICTGYRPHGINTIGHTEKYESEARAICEQYDRPYEERMEEIAKIREKWIAELRTI